MGASDNHALAAGRNAGISKQIISSAIVSFVSLLGGMVQGWTSPMTLILRSEDSPVGQMTKADIANLVSVPKYVGLFLGFILIYIANRLGRKPALIAVSIPNIIGYGIMVFATSPIWLYIGKLVSAFGTMGLTLPQMYVSETTHESIRGILMSTCTMQINSGILVGYVLGRFLNFKWFNFVYAAIPTVLVVLIFWLPETPYYFVAKSKEDEAKKSLMWLRGGDALLAEDELQTIKSTKFNDHTKEKPSLWKEMKTRATKIAFIVSLFGYVLQCLSGIHAVINYAGIIFQEAGSPLSPADSSIITAILNLVASFINLFLIDKFGRKPLLYVSFVGGGVSLTILTIFLYAQQNGGFDVSQVGWIPIGSLGVFIFCYGVGLASVPGVLLNEMAPTNVKAMMGIVISFIAHVLVLLIVQSFPYLDDNIGLWFCFAIPAICNIIGVFFTMFVVRETRGKSLSQIENELNNE